MRKQQSKPSSFMARRFEVVLSMLVCVSFSFACSSPQPHAVRKAPRAASSYQEEMLADGKVTFDEYSQAIRDFLQCARSKGLTVEGPTLNGQQIYEYALVVSNSSAFDRARALYESCYDRYASWVDPRWQTRPGRPTTSVASRR